VREVTTQRFLSSCTVCSTASVDGRVAIKLGVGVAIRSAWDREWLRDRVSATSSQMTLACPGAPYLGRFFARALDCAISAWYLASSTSKLSNPNPSHSDRAYRSVSAPIATSRAHFLPSAASCS
jgi:hypothetical protein